MFLSGEVTSYTLNERKIISITHGLNGRPFSLCGIEVVFKEFQI